jgi:aminoglycoside 3-N-acetyltransferase
MNIKINYISAVNLNKKKIIIFLYSKISHIHPYVEVKLKKLYWNNINFFKKYRPKTAKLTNEDVNWNEVICYLKQNGITKGGLMLLHSSYEAIKSSKHTPVEIIRSLRALLGDEGTLAMPVIRIYKEEPPLEKVLKTDISKILCIYNLQSKNIMSGLLPFYLTREEDVKISRYPLNPMAAVGRLATSMMINNISEDSLPPCGKNSSWAFCVENDAIVVGIGVDLCHHLTITHVATDLYMEEWPIKNWYLKRAFDIIDYDFHKRITVLERKPFWGSFYLTGSNYRNDLIKNNILISKIVGGVIVEIVYSKKLIDFLRSRNQNGYPFYIPKKYFK